MAVVPDEALSDTSSMLASEKRYDIQVARAGTTITLSRSDVTEHQKLFRRYQLLAENESDAAYETDTSGSIRWISPSIERVLGWTATSLLGSSAIDLVHEDDRAAVQDYRVRVYGGATIEPVRVRFRRLDGEFRWFSWHSQPTTGANGKSTGALVGIRDCQDEVVSRRALLALSLGNGIVARATSETELLDEMCQTIADSHGYLFAWYGGRIDNDAKTVAKLAMSKGHRRYLDDIETSWGDDGGDYGATAKTIRDGTTTVQDDLEGDLGFVSWRERDLAHGFRSTIALAVRVAGEVEGALTVYAAEVQAFDANAVALLEELASQLGSGIARLREQADLKKSLNGLELLSAAVEQSVDSIIVADPSATILYANPAALHSSGYSLGEVVGANPRMFASGLQAPGLYAAMWARLLGGHTWHGVLVNKRKNGELYEEDVRISPVHDGDGSLLAYVAVKHDLSVERRLEADLSREQHDHAGIVALMKALRPAVTLQATAIAFSDAVASLDFVDSVIVMLRRDDGSLTPIGVGGLGLEVAALKSAIALNECDSLIARCEKGPWWIDVAKLDDPANRLLGALADASGFTAIANAPIRADGKVIGLLAILTKDPNAPSWIASRLPAFEELGAYAGTLFGARAEQYGRAESVRSSLRDILDHERFHPVFQPVVDLASRVTIGFEALTRFDDGTRPDIRFNEAHTVGLGSAFEAACVTAALAAAKRLPAGVWLAVNFSPAALVDGHAASVLRGAGREIIIEVTEHAVVESYAAVQRAVQALSPCRLSVDDAGAGYAGLRHILELSPDIVKLDISLVRDIDTDQARRALVAGMCDFATQTGTTLIAEGVETQAEADTLVALGVHWAQGFLFGQPESAHFEANDVGI